MPKNDREGEQGSASVSRGTTPGRTRGNAANLSREARVKGGQRSAQVQVRDERGQFAGRAGGESRSRQRRGNQGQQQNPSENP